MGIFLIQCTSDTAQQSCKAEETIIPVPHEACIQALPAQCCVTRVSAKRIGSRFPCPQTLKDPYWNSKITVPLFLISVHTGLSSEAEILYGCFTGYMESWLVKLTVMTKVVL